MNNKTYKLFVVGLLLILGIWGCRQEFLQGSKIPANGKVYLPGAANPDGIIAGLSEGNLKVDTNTHTAGFSVPVFRGGFGDTDSFSVEVAVNNDLIQPLVQAGILPATTVSPATDDYELDSKIAVHLQDGVMQGQINPKFKVENLKAYGGKTIAIGLRIDHPSKFTINDSMRQVVLYFDVDSLLDAAIPPSNLIDPAAWQILHIASNDNVKFELQSDGSILATGGSNGHQGVFQPVEVRANQDYKIDMNVAGSGAINTWFEVYVAAKVPVQGQDYTDDPAGIKRISLNTWSGCGNAPFNNLLSLLSCSGSGATVRFPTAGVVYVVIKSGGENLGTEGITINNIDFRKVQ